MAATEGKRTPLLERHRALGARLVPFAGYQMPLSYAGQIAEHQAVRQSLGLFDLSHMGEFRLRGPGALAAADRLLTNRLLGAPVGQAVYSPMCAEDGGIIDDLIAYRLAGSVLLVVNAANIAKDAAWVRGQIPPDVTFTDESDATALIAVQGPRVEACLAPLTPAPISRMDTYTVLPATVAGIETLLSRTGYTGEDGFELYLPGEHAPALWDRLMEAGTAHGVQPVGLAARDTLRFEMGYCLYGNDIDETTSPWEAGLGWTVKLDKGEFIGRRALEEQKRSGVTRRLVGLEPDGARVIPRAGCPILDGEEIGRITSGTFSPSLDRGLALGYVPTAQARPGTRVELDVRGRRSPAQVVRLPFFTAGSRKAAPRIAPSA